MQLTIRACPVQHSKGSFFHSQKTNKPIRIHSVSSRPILVEQSLNADVRGKPISCGPNPSVLELNELTGS